MNDWSSWVGRSETVHDTPHPTPLAALTASLDHPARDPRDNFYLATAERTFGGPLLMRSQTSTVQIRAPFSSQGPATSKRVVPRNWTSLR